MTKTQLAKSYGDLPLNSIADNFVFGVPGNKAANYRVHFGKEGLVTSFDLELVSQDCAG